MTTVEAILEPHADGSLHLPIPPDLRGAGKLRVVAKLESASPAPAATPRGGAGAWAREALGSARTSTDSETDPRMAYYREKFGQI